MKSESVIGTLLVTITSVIAMPAIQVSTNNNDMAFFGNDPDPVTCSKTGHHSEAWWSVDLGAMQTINGVTIKGDIGGSPKIFVEEDTVMGTVNHVCAVWYDPPTTTTTTFNCLKPLTGNRIRISARARREDQYVQLELCDLTVF